MSALGRGAVQASHGSGLKHNKTHPLISVYKVGGFYCDILRSASKELLQHWRFPTAAAFAIVARVDLSFQFLFFVKVSVPKDDDDDCRRQCLEEGMCDCQR